MKVVMAAAECAPFAKAGGLADVMGALPKELSSLGHEVTVLLPEYSLIAEEYKENFTEIENIEFDFMKTRVSCKISSWDKDGVHFVFLGNEDYFHGPEIYTQNDMERYAFFVRAVLQVMKTHQFDADV
ncbi:MAG TPA: glycogen/starch synthase, partial [Planococcus sp. (in: firmicutes)]|nr:glycogen/starch synthase [Planococcus sp. (in: firmicutes)]